ncbi:MAG: 2-oxoglutarate dehydrogenase complex dihydrolipoyllysine-residue succinyltransferase [Alphaproteobacteria bacterium]|nr:2-oxoglutarate dehydrogenase complex dihydrolipoyllysine-residue succinyltransferase [Alphaproteobacteria bacterium]
MATEIKVPTLGESVSEATVARWLKQPGEAVARDEAVVELETDKVTLEVPSPAAGTLGEILAAEGANVPVGAVLATIADGAAAAAAPRSSEQAPVASAAHPALERIEVRAEAGAPSGPTPAALDRAGPAARKLVAETGLDIASLTPTGRGGRLTKADVLQARDRPAAPPAEAPGPAAQARPDGNAGGRETRVRMSRLRRRIAERLKQAQNAAAMLTTFNEIDMSQAIALRERWRDGFEKKHGVRLGFMSIFVKAAIVALKELPAVNAEIDGEDIVYKNHYDIGVAVGTGQGLVVPVVRDADHMSFAEVEKEIAGLGRKARDGKLTIEDLSGGTFTISNGGVYGSLLSTPILNPPQSAILGMHKIERRPVAVGDSGAERVEIRPMMYVALSYDHRIIDGREAVTFLVRLKECVEDPSRILFDI